MNINTKSKIQLIKEQMIIKEMFKNNLLDLMEKYILEDNIFHNNRGNIEENIKGYFAINEEFDNIVDAINSLKDNQSVRIIENNKFQTGVVFESINETNEYAKVYDIENGNYLER